MYSRNKFTLHRVATARRLARPTAQDYLYKFGLVLFIALIFTAADAFSASGISPKFDGRYEGALTPASSSNPNTCQAVTVDEFVIKGGYVRPPAKVSNVQSVIFDGFVTEEGFVTGHFRLPGGERNQFEGRMVDEAHSVMLSGGLTDAASGCSYLLEVRKAD
jgi:hypothetical protein